MPGCVDAGDSAVTGEADIWVLGLAAERRGFGVRYNSRCWAWGWLPATPSTHGPFLLSLSLLTVERVENKDKQKDLTLPDSCFTFRYISCLFFVCCFSRGVITPHTRCYVFSCLFCAAPASRLSTLHRQAFAGFVVKRGALGPHRAG